MSNFIQITEGPVSRIFKTSQKKDNKLPVIIVANDDTDYGLYVRKLINILKVIKAVPFSKKDLKHIKPGEFIVFNDSFLYEEDFDVRVEDNPAQLLEENYAGRKVYMFYLAKDFSKLIALLDKVYRTRKQRVIKNTNYLLLTTNGYQQRKKEPTITINVRIHDDELSDVTVHDTWVKIGFEQFKIYADDFGNRYIVYHGVKKYIKYDRFGNGRLV